MSNQAKAAAESKRVSMSLSPEVIGAELYDVLMSKSKHARANEMLRLMLIGNLYEKQLYASQGLIRAEGGIPQRPALSVVPAAEPYKSTAPTKQETPAHDPVIAEDMLSLFGDGISLAG